MGLALVYRLAPSSQRAVYNAVGGTIYIPLSGLFGVLTAFMIGLGWQEFDEAQETEQSEASAIATLYWRAAELLEPEREQVQELTRSYTQAVVDEEWLLMQQERESQRAWFILDNLRKSVAEFEPNTNAEQVLRDHLAEQVEEVLDYRRLRLLDSREGLPPMLWAVLLGTGMIVVSFTYLFGVHRFWVHSLMVVMVTTVIATSLLTIKSMERPFGSGANSVTPRSFEAVLQDFEATSER